MTAPAWLKVAVVVPCGVAAFALSAGWFNASARDDVVEAQTHAARPEASNIAAAVSDVPAADSTAQKRLEPESSTNPFGQLNLQPPALASVGLPAGAKPVAPKPTKVVAPPPPPPPPAPTAPPLPFVAIGSIEGPDATAGQKIAFLQQQDTLLVVRKGEAIGPLYRVEDISADRVEFTYLPLNQRQWLSLVR